jgi:hypothetical protein
MDQIQVTAKTLKRNVGKHRNDGLAIRHDVVQISLYLPRSTIVRHVASDEKGFRSERFHQVSNDVVVSTRSQASQTS